jgi:cytochrome c-type biogenesis protein CcsB
MEFFKIQTFLGNFSFSLLFLIMLFFLIESNFKWISKFHFLAFFGIILANISLALLLIFRWAEENHFPLSNLYESLIFLSWSFTTIHIVLEKVTNSQIIGIVISPISLFTNAFGNFSLPSEMQKASSLVPALQSNWLMMHVTIMMLSYAALITGSLFAFSFLIVKHLVPAPDILEGLLRTRSGADNSVRSTNITFGDVSDKRINKNKIFGYGVTKAELLSAPKKPSQTYFETQKSQKALTSYSFTASTYYPKNTFDKPAIVTALTSDTLSGCEKEMSEQESDNSIKNYSKISTTLDNLSYRTLGIGFPLLTIGILSGAVWANEAWGEYWSWDPKETWAFITWLIYAIYLHTRITKGWQGTKPALIASIGFIVVWICYLGVNLLSKGLHSYGWVQ